MIPGWLDSFLAGPYCWSLVPTAIAVVAGTLQVRDRRRAARRRGRAMFPLGQATNLSARRDAARRRDLP